MHLKIIDELKDELKKYDITYQYYYIYNNNKKFLVFYKNSSIKYEKFTIGYDIIKNAKDRDERLLIILNRSDKLIIFKNNETNNEKGDKIISIEERKKNIRKKLIDKKII